jgi:hypothetical protein
MLSLPEPATAVVTVQVDTRGTAKPVNPTHIDPEHPGMAFCATHEAWLPYDLFSGSDLSDTARSVIHCLTCKDAMVKQRIDARLAGQPHEIHRVSSQRVAAAKRRVAEQERAAREQAEQAAPAPVRADTLQSFLSMALSDLTSAERIRLAHTLLAYEGAA